MEAKSLILTLKGGLGNQMFGYAAARRLALVNGAELVLDVEGGFKRDKTYRRQFSLAPFAIAGRMATPSEKFEPFEALRRSWMRTREARKPFEERLYIRQEFGEFDPRLLALKIHDRLWIEGVWAGEDYFSDITEIIRRDFSITPPVDDHNRAMMEAIKNTAAVGLHVRFFSTADDSDNRNASRDYYHRAITYISARVENAHFYVFSDQPEQAASLLPLEGHRTSYVSHNSSDAMAYADLWLMSACRHIIAANSTFSWWGAWLAEVHDPAQLIIVPDPEKLQHGHWSLAGLLPTRWKKL